MFHYSIHYLHVFTNEIGLAAWTFTPINNPLRCRPSSMKLGTTFPLPNIRKNSNVSMTFPWSSVSGDRTKRSRWSVAQQ